MTKPDPFIEVLAEELDVTDAWSGLFVGYEKEDWRFKDLASHLFEWLPDFALTHQEQEDFNTGNAVKLIQKAAKIVYQSDKYKSRGEFGEIFLHMILRQIIETQCVISKIYFKTGVNDTVKGYDAVHCRKNNDKLELWLGEVKFYQDISGAIKDVIDEIKCHTEVEYLKNECILIGNKLTKDTPHYEHLKKLLDKNTSLDEVFDCLVIPVLLTYDSTMMQKHKVVTDEFKEELQTELEKHKNSFYKKCPNLQCKVHLFLFPLQQKALLLKELDEKLKQWQTV